MFAVIIAAYTLGRSSNQSISLSRGLQEIHQYAPPVLVEIGYRNEAGIKTQRRVAVLKSLRHDDGRLLLLGFLGSRRPRTFRVDRIVSLATPDGEVLDKRAFLTDWLSIPPKLIAPKRYKPVYNSSGESPNV